MERDTGEVSIKDFIRNVIFFVITGMYGGMGKHRDKRGDSYEDQDVVLCFTYTPVFTFSLILILVERS